MKRYIHLILSLFFIFPVYVKAQEAVFFVEDSVPVLSDFLALEDSLVVDSAELAENLVPTGQKVAFKPNPTKAMIYSAIVPGLGQIYNRKYWKLPLVYGSFIGCAYAVTWNGSMYNGYKKAYIDFIDNDPKTDSWKDYRPVSLREKPENPDEWDASERNWFKDSVLKGRKDYFRRYRDLSYIISIGVYAIWIIDAYVDAQLFDFDISPDLSLRVDPVLFERTPATSRTVGLQWSFTF